MRQSEISLEDQMALVSLLSSVAYLQKNVQEKIPSVSDNKEITFIETSLRDYSPRLFPSETKVDIFAGIVCVYTEMLFECEKQ